MEVKLNICPETARRWVAVACLCLLGGLAPSVALAQQRPSLVRVDSVRSEPMSQTVPVVGRLVARQAGAVAAQISGPILEFRVEVGDRVVAGDVIAVLAAWGPCVEDCCPADVDLDGAVGFGDVITVLARWSR